MTDCIFCKIIDGDIPSAKVYEDEKVLAFLDMSQATPGHTLVIPKKHVSNIFEYDAAVASDVSTRVPKIARAIQQTFPDVKGMNIINNNGELAYQTVFHSHWHLIPRYTEDDGFSMNFANNQESYTSDEFQSRAQHISKHIEEA